MIRKAFLVAIVSMVFFSLAVKMASAQYYYPAPQYYQPMMIMQSPPADSAGAEWASPVAGSADKQQVDQKPGVVVPLKKVSAALQVDVEDLPRNSIYEVPASRLGTGEQEVPQMASHAIGTGTSCGTCGMTPARSAAFNYQQQGGSQYGIKIPDCKDDALHILDFPGVEAMADCCPDCTTGNCDDDLVRWPSKEAALADKRCDPECLVCVKEPFICQTTVTEETEVVFFRCYERTVPFHGTHCEDQRCIKEVGKRTVKKLEPCCVTIKYPCKKTIVDYREVWICIRCDCHE